MIVSLVVLNMKRPISVHLLTDIEDRRHNMGSQSDDRQGHIQLGFLFLTKVSKCSTQFLTYQDEPPAKSCWCIDVSVNHNL